MQADLFSKTQATSDLDQPVDFFGMDGIVTECVLYFLLKVLNYGSMLIAMTFNFWAILVISITIPLSGMLLEIIEDRAYIQKIKDSRLKVAIK